MTDVHLVDVSPHHLRISWNGNPFNCPAIYYNITTDNCGVCESTTYEIETTCYNPIINGRPCTLALQVVFCGIRSGIKDKVTIIEVTLSSKYLWTSVNDSACMCLLFMVAK